MKIKHKLTGDIKEKSFHFWLSQIKNKENYQILDRGDTVYIRQIENDGSRKYLHEIDRDHAVRMIRNKENRFDYVEMSQLPFNVKIRQILQELNSKEHRTGELTELLKDLRIDFIPSDLTDISDFLSENKYANIALNPSGCFLTATLTGLEFVRVPIIVEPDYFAAEAFATYHDDKLPVENVEENPSEKSSSKGIVLRAEKDTSQTEVRGKSWFFGIGINTYNAPISNLHNARKDIEDFLQLLLDYYELDESFVLLDTEATRSNILDKLQMVDERIGKADKLIIYYSGHGYLDNRDRGFWLPADAEEGRSSTYLHNATIRDYIAGIEAKHTLLISDSCFSGALLSRNLEYSKVVMEELERDKSRWVISSGRQKEKVADGPPGKNSPFARSLLKVLHEHQDSSLNTGLLFDKVLKLTRFDYEQLPQSGPIKDAGHEGGQYIFHRKLKSIDEKEDELWRRCMAENSVKACSEFLKQFPNGKYAEEAIIQIKWFEQDDEAWKNACQHNLISSFHEYLRKFPNGQYRKEAHKRIAELGKEITVPRITSKPMEELVDRLKDWPPPKNEDPESESKHYVGPAQLPHQKGKWAVFQNGAQLSGTVRNTKEEAQSIVDGFNKKFLKRIELSNGVVFQENGVQTFGTEQLPSWKYFGGPNGPHGVELIYAGGSIKIVKPNSLSLPKTILEHIEMEADKLHVQLLEMHGIHLAE